MHRVGQYATLNANYMAARLAQASSSWPTLLVAPPTNYLDLPKRTKKWCERWIWLSVCLTTGCIHLTLFPRLVPECVLVEPTETESKQELDAFVDALIAVREEALQDADFVKQAPYTTPVRRLDDVKAARELDLTWSNRLS